MQWRPHSVVDAQEQKERGINSKEIRFLKEYHLMMLYRDVETPETHFPNAMLLVIPPLFFYGAIAKTIYSVNSR